MSKVYVVQDNSSQNFQPAFRFGTLITLFPRGNHTKSSEEGSALAEELYSLLHPIKPDDYIILNGDPVLCGLVTAVAADLLDGQVQFLKWNKFDEEYRPLTIRIWEPEHVG